MARQNSRVFILIFLGMLTAFGPLSDKYGRRPLLIAGMFLFLVSTLGCVYSQTALQFVGWRLVQGIAGASGIVIPGPHPDKESD